MDLHARSLVDRGCPPHLAARILAPLDGAPAVLSAAASVAPVTAAEPASIFPDPESERWVAGWAPRRPVHDAAVARLHELLVRAARFELAAAGAGTRRRSTTSRTQAADDAPMAILAQARHLPRRQPLHHVGLQVRAARGGREGAPPRVAGPRGPLECRRLGALPTAGRPERRGDRRAARRGADAIADALTPHQRAVLVAITLTTCRSTSSPSGSARPAARSTRPFTTPGASCGHARARARTRSTEGGGRR